MPKKKHSNTNEQHSNRIGNSFLHENIIPIVGGCLIAVGLIIAFFLLEYAVITMPLLAIGLAVGGALIGTSIAAAFKYKRNKKLKRPDVAGIATITTACVAIMGAAIINVLLPPLLAFVVSMIFMGVVLIIGAKIYDKFHSKQQKSHTQCRRSNESSYKRFVQGGKKQQPKEEQRTNNRASTSYVRLHSPTSRRKTIALEVNVATNTHKVTR